MPASEIKRIGFVSTRISGTDGVSLEIRKWAEVLERNGISCFYLTGNSDRPEVSTALIQEAYFGHPAIQTISDEAFSSNIRTAELTDRIDSYARNIRDQLRSAIERFRLDGLVVQNALTIPMNLPLGIAIVKVIQETGIFCIAHHHDFYWERDRFLVNCVRDYLRYAFPPALPHIHHVTINSLAAEEFSRRTGLSSRVIPNVMNFASPPSSPDPDAASFREAIGLSNEDLLVLQPTRVVARKGIEHSIELVRRLDPERARLVITHASTDEGNDYRQRIQEFAQMMKVSLLFVSDRIGPRRGPDGRGRNRFTIQDAYQAADLVAYPSEYEGFGNAFVEAIYFKKPIVCNRYAIFRTDIEPCGFRPILFDGFLTHKTIAEVRRVLEDEPYRRSMVEHNYELGGRHFSYEVLERELDAMVSGPRPVRCLRWRHQWHGAKSLQS